MGIETRILRRCGLAVAALALLAPTTSRPATQAESPFLGNVACLSDEQRTELVHREMGEFLVVGKELMQRRGQISTATAAREAAATALTGCEGAAGPLQGTQCDAERERLARAEAQLQRAREEQEKAKAEFPVLAASRIQAVRAEYPACESR
jgi:hypothetical protein